MVYFHVEARGRNQSELPLEHNWFASRWSLNSRLKWKFQAFVDQRGGLDQGGRGLRPAETMTRPGLAEASFFRFGIGFLALLQFTEKWKNDVND